MIKIEKSERKSKLWYHFSMLLIMLAGFTLATSIVYLQAEIGVYNEAISHLISGAETTIDTNYYEFMADQIRIEKQGYGVIGIFLLFFSSICSIFGYWADPNK